MINTIKMIPNRCGQRPVTEVILDPVKLTALTVPVYHTASERNSPLPMLTFEDFQAPLTKHEIVEARAH